MRHPQPTPAQIPSEAIPDTLHPKFDGGTVKVGARDGKPWEPVMLYQVAHDELVTLFAMVGQIADWLGNSSRLEGPAWTKEAEAVGRELMAMKAKIEARGGEPSAGLRGRPAGLTGG